MREPERSEGIRPAVERRPRASEGDGGWGARIGNPFGPIGSGCDPIVPGGDIGKPFGPTSAGGGL
jgi:hypothetical protein